MNSKTTLISLLLAIIVLLCFFLIDAQEGKQVHDEFLFHFNPMEVTRLSIQDGSNSYQLNRQATQWYLSSTPADLANAQKVEHLLHVAKELRALNIIYPRELKNSLSLSSLGLENPKRSFLIHEEGKKDQILFIGNEALGDKSFFAQLGKEKMVFVIPSTFVDLAFAPRNDFADLHLTNLEFSNLEEISIVEGRKRLVLKKENNNWEIKEPIVGKVALEALKSWMDPLLKTEVMTRVSSNDQDASVLSAYGLDQPRSMITLLQKNSLEPLKLSLGNSVVENSSHDVYISSSERHAIFLAPQFFEQLFSITPEVLRDHQFLELNLDTIDRILISQEGIKQTLHRQEGGSDQWLRENDQPISKNSIEGMINGLSKTKILSYLVATPSNLVAKGFQSPNATTASIQFIAHLSENTPDQEAGDYTVMEIVFGKKIGETIYARIGNDPELLEIPARTIDFLKVN